jgi:hypothetical protein
MKNRSAIPCLCLISVTGSTTSFEEIPCGTTVTIVGSMCRRSITVRREYSLGVRIRRADSALRGIIILRYASFERVK